MTQRELITLAVIAFDVMLKDAMEEDSKGEKVHPIAHAVMQCLTDMLSFRPEMDRAHQQYILNVAEISADIKRIFLSTPISDDDLQAMLILQAERLKWLGSDRAKDEALEVR